MCTHHLSQTLPKPPRLICVLLLVSSLLHAVVLVFWPFSPPAGIAGGGVLQVRLAPGKNAIQTDKAVQPTGEQRLRGRPAEVPEESRVAAKLPAGLTAESNRLVPPTQKTLSQQTPAAQKQQAAQPPVRNQKHARADSQRTAKQRPDRQDRKQPSPHRATAGSHDPGTEAPVSASSPVESTDDPGSRTAAAPVAGEKSGTRDKTSELIQAALREAMLPYFDYPLLARRRGWEGRVKISLLVKPDGGLTDMVVLESSGYRVLDQAALEDLRQVDRLPQATAWLQGRQLDVVLPVLYRFR